MLRLLMANRWARCAWVWFLMSLGPGLDAADLTLVFTSPATPVIAGAQTEIWLNVLNPSPRELTWRFPRTIAARLVTPERSWDSTLELRAGAGPEEVVLAPGNFARREYSLQWPVSMTGRVIVESPELGAARLVVEAQPAPPEEKPEANKSGLARILRHAEPTGEGRNFQPGRFFKEHISGYQPFYFIAGTESPNAKFQFSFKYQLLNQNGALAEAAPVLRGAHFGYTQTSLWDWNQASAPFLDSSYKPELLYTWEKVVGGQPTNWFRLDLQPGFQHESNGKADADSRSLNTAYLQPTLTLGRPDRFQLVLQPRVWAYLGDLSDNPDLAHYRGNAELRAIVGWQRGLQLSSLGRLGNSGNRGSVQLDLTYPMMSLLSGSFSVYLHAQYFIGYGESLLLYRDRSSAFRFGFSLYR